MAISYLTACDVVPSKVIKPLQIKFATLAHLSEFHFLKDRIKRKVSEVPSETRSLIMSMDDGKNLKIPKSREKKVSSLSVLCHAKCVN